MNYYDCIVLFNVSIPLHILFIQPTLKTNDNTTIIIFDRIFVKFQEIWCHVVCLWEASKKISVMRFQEHLQISTKSFGIGNFSSHNHNANSVNMIKELVNNLSNKRSSQGFLQKVDALVSIGQTLRMVFPKNDLFYRKRPDCEMKVWWKIKTIKVILQRDNKKRLQKVTDCTRSETWPLSP